MKLKLKLFLFVIALVQLGSLCSIFFGIVGGFDNSSDGALADEDFKEIMHHQPKNKTSQGSVQEEPVKPPERVILMVIDALRWDFLTPENFPFVLKEVKKFTSTGVLRYKVSLDSPTVTLPRIKTLVTGRSPTYLDVIKNLQPGEDDYISTTKINQDNIVWSLRRERPESTICFYGDEAWMRLFPLDKDGNSSYFAKWEAYPAFFIKDFYQVDHNITKNLEKTEDCNFLILHYPGLDHIGHVYGPFDRPNLIHSKLNEMDDVIQKLHTMLLKNGRGKSLILVTGDHGMANVGGHGGSSLEEVTTPLVAIITKSSVHQNQKPAKDSVKQVDIAPTLSSLWGIQVPRESRGQLILDLIEEFQTSQQLAASYQANCEHLLKVLGNSREAATYKLWWNEISKMEKPLSIKKYIELEQELGSAVNNEKEDGKQLWSRFATEIFFLTVSEICILVSIVGTLSKVWKDISSAVVLALLPPFALYFSSSFIEEEHYLRYFMYPALLGGFFLFTAPTDLNCGFKLIEILVIHRVSITLNQTGDKWSSLADLNDYLSQWNLTELSAVFGSFLVYYFSRNVSSSKTYSFSMLFILCLKLVTSLWSDKTGPFLFNFAEHQVQQVSYVVLIGNLVLHVANRLPFRNLVYTSVVLLSLILHRLQNVIVLGLTIAQICLIHELFDTHANLKTELKKNGKIRTSLLTQIIIIWFAHSSFFYQGNSNGLATIDVSAGYIGFESFTHRNIIGLLIFINTYGCPMLIYVTHLTHQRASQETSIEKLVNGHSAESFSSSKKNARQHPFNPITLLFLLSNGAEGLIYAIALIVFQNHLFIWTVFVPKLIYLIAQSVMFSILCALGVVL